MAACNVYLMSAHQWRTADDTGGYDLSLPVVDHPQTDRETGTKADRKVGKLTDSSSYKDTYRKTFGKTEGRIRRQASRNAQTDKPFHDRLPL